MQKQSFFQRIKNLTPRSVKRTARVLLIEIPTQVRYYSRLIVRGDRSQFGEITVARRLLGRDWPKYVVEVGAFDAKRYSNSYCFICEGWQAVLIEPHPANFARVAGFHAGNSAVRCVQKACSNTTGQSPLFFDKEAGASGGVSPTLSTDNNWFMQQIRSDQSVQVELDTLSNILSACGTPRDFSLLSVDTEGMDLAVLEGLDPAKFRPRVIITEEYPWEPEKNQRKHDLLRARDYVLKRLIGMNSIWRAKEHDS
jgi:FkbM family methyltransferase